MLTIGSFARRGRAIEEETIAINRDLVITRQAYCLMISLLYPTVL